jgi:hypothetical protein
VTRTSGYSFLFTWHSKMCSQTRSRSAPIISITYHQFFHTDSHTYIPYVFFNVSEYIECLLQGIPGTAEHMQRIRVTTHASRATITASQMRGGGISSGWQRDTRVCCPHMPYKKAIPLQGRTGPDGSRMLRLPDFLDNRHMKVTDVNPTQRPPLPPRNFPGPHFF